MLTVMSIDMVILAAVAVFAAIGFYTGAVQQFSHWIGLAAAFFLAKPAATMLAPVLSERMGWELAWTANGLGLVSFPVMLIVATLISRAILNAMIPGKQRNKPDRVAGIFLGAGKAAVIAWVAVSAALAFEKPLVKFVPGAEDAIGASSAAAFTRKHSLFDLPLPSAFERLREVSEMSEDPEAAKALLDNPALKSLINDPELKKALQKGDLSVLRDNPQLKEMLSDPELLKQLEAIKPEQ